MHDNGLLGIDYAAGTPVLNDPATRTTSKLPDVRRDRRSIERFYVEFSSRPTPLPSSFSSTLIAIPPASAKAKVDFLLEVTTDAAVTLVLDEFPLCH